MCITLVRPSIDPFIGLAPWVRDMFAFLLDPSRSSQTTRLLNVLPRPTATYLHGSTFFVEIPTHELFSPLICPVCHILPPCRHSRFSTVARMLALETPFHVARENFCSQDTGFSACQWLVVHVAPLFC